MCLTVGLRESALSLPSTQKPVSGAIRRYLSDVSGERAKQFYALHFDYLRDLNGQHFALLTCTRILFRARYSYSLVRNALGPRPQSLIEHARTLTNSYRFIASDLKAEANDYEYPCLSLAVCGSSPGDRCFGSRMEGDEIAVHEIAGHATACAR